MCLRHAGVTCNTTFLHLYCVRHRGLHAASQAPRERKHEPLGAKRFGQIKQETRIMKHILTTIFILLFSLVHGQSIKEIKIWNSRLNAMLPIAGEVPEGEISFIKKSNGDFVSTFYYVDNRKKSLKKPITLENSRVKTFQSWLTTNKKEFRLEEIGIDTSALSKQISTSNNLTFVSERNVVIKIDTFMFCNQLIEEKGNIESRTFKEEITFIDSLGVSKSFIFDNDNSFNKNLYQYILLYQLFRNKLSEEAPPFGTFNENHMLHLILVYLKTIECEEYYYQEYLEKNPNKTVKEKRMRTGWNFQDFMIKEKNWKREYN